jgi:hypothetical protein
MDAGRGGSPVTDRYPGLRACVDSGQHRIGWATGDGGRILQCGLWRDDLKAPQAVPRLDVATVIQEVPVHYPTRGPRGRRTTRKVNPNDLIGIAAKSGWFAGAAAPAAAYVPITPRRWKGTINGDTFLNMILARMTESEIQLLEGTAPDSLLHNVIDACGMVLWTQGRI